MRATSHGPAARGPRRREALPRPIAGELRLTGAHIQRIDQSHERCAALGLSRIERPDHTPLARPDLALARDRNRRLCGHAAPVMEMLYEQIVQSQSMVVLTDAAGVIVHSIGDDDFLERAARVALRPGAVWSEPAKGTNAIGTALIEEVPTLVHADEHYVHANQFLTCSAAPILDPRGNILGVLDVSGDHRGYHQHTMALVKMSARMIENGWLADDHRDVMRLHLHQRAEFIGTLMEGILAVTADGRIVGANRGALEQLGLSGAAVRKQTLGSLLGTTVGVLVDRFRSPLATPAPLRLADGRTVHVLARFDWPVWASLAEAVAASAAGAAHTSQAPHAPGPVPPAVLAPAPPQALATLRTGDAATDKLLDRLARVRDSGLPLLLLGESGSGRQTLARALHTDSARGRQPFVVVHCGALAPALLEAELLGVAGTAAGAVRHAAQVGRIVQANGGTLYLDEVQALTPPLQAHLLRLLQEGQVSPLCRDGRDGHDGGDGTDAGGGSVAVDVAVVCASSASLRATVEAGQFNADLYWRLNGLALRVPPLRERADLAVLVQRMLRAIAPGRGLQLSPEVAAMFVRHPWPGNLRQLQHLLHAASLLAGTDGVIQAAHLPPDFLDELPPAAAVTAPQADAAPAVPGIASLAAQEALAIRHAVEAAGGNISAAAKALGISRNTIYRKLHWGQRPAG